MDELLKALNEVSTILFPIVGVICLVLLGMVLFNINKTIKRLSVTIDEVDKVISSTGSKIDQLDGPLNTLNSVSKSVDIVNDSAVSAISSAVKFSMKHSDSIINWGKDTFVKRGKNAKDEKKEEDFGIYE